MSQIELMKESWLDIWPECEPLMRAHDEEVGLADARVPFEVDEDAAGKMDQAGMLHILAARTITERLIGYAIWYLVPNLSSRGVRLAAQGPWYVTPRFRDHGVGGRLWIQSISDLRQMGIKIVHVHHSAREPSLGKFFVNIGAVPIESIYALWIGSASVGEV